MIFSKREVRKFSVQTGIELILSFRMMYGSIRVTGHFFIEKRHINFRFIDDILLFDYVGTIWNKINSRLTFNLFDFVAKNGRVLTSPQTTLQRNL